jgi:purine-nucleoside phosphorylase
MPQIHLRAEPGDYAPLVLMPGDPGRATMIAGLLDGGLDNTRLVNQYRSLLGYTGTYNGVPVSVLGSGMGMPSTGIYVTELVRFYGAKRLLRVGTCGGLDEGLSLGDVVIASTFRSRSVELSRPPLMMWSLTVSTVGAWKPSTIPRA